MTRTPAYPLHLIAETTPGMHPWETIPGTFGDMDEAVAAGQELADERRIRVHVNDQRCGFWHELVPSAADVKVWSRKRSTGVLTYRWVPVADVEAYRAEIDADPDRELAGRSASREEA